MKLHLALAACAALALTGCQQSETESGSSAKRTPVSREGSGDILIANMDTTVNPADDFFDYANGGWVKKTPIPAEESSWGIGNLVVEENLKRLREISEE